MTVESYAQAPAYTISGVGPYPIPHPYLAGTITAYVLIEDVPTELDKADFSVDPATAADQGNLLLTAAAATTHDGRTLWLERATPLEQGWMARDDGREAGMEAQLDQGTMSAQEDRSQINAALRARKPMAAFDPQPGRVPMVRADGLGWVNGPTADEVESAQIYAEAAKASEDRINLGALDAAVEATANDAQATAADRVQTGLDRQAAEQAATTAADDANAQIAPNVTAAQDAEAGAVAAQGAAESARDAAFVNADVYTDIATGRAAVADGDQFQVVSGNEVVRYRRDSATTQTEMARYPAKSFVDAIERRSSGILVPTLNLFNKNDADYTENFFVDWTDGSLQAENGSPPYDATGFIPVTAGLQYYVSNISHIAWYDASGSFLSGAQTPGNPIIAPASAAYIRCSLNLANTTRDTFYVRQGAGPLDAYEPYGGKLDPSSVFDLPTKALANDAVTPLKVSFLTYGKNLFDTNSPNILENTFMGANGSTSASTTYFVSDFVEVEAGETYFISSAGQSARFLTAYDGAFNVVSEEGSNNNISTVNVPVSGVKYYRFTGFNSNRATYQFEKGPAATGFEKFGFYFTDGIVQESGASASSWADKKWTSYGDSVTAQNMWQPYAVSEFGLVHTNLGVGGRQIAGTSGMNTQAAVDTIAADQDLLTVMGGVNDWAQSRTLGAVEGTDTETFYGALNVMFERLTTRLPNCRIIAMTPNYAEFADGNWETRGGWASGIINGAGLSTRDYAEAVRVAAKRWGIPVADVSADEGVNTVNVDAYRKDDGNHIHPNEIGGPRLAEVLCARLRDLEPLV